MWTEAARRTYPAQQRSPLARRRPYDLRHAGVSLRVNAGAPATEVARRAGYAVAVMLKIYAEFRLMETGHSPVYEAPAAVAAAVRDVLARTR